MSAKETLKAMLKKTVSRDAKQRPSDRQLLEQMASSVAAIADRMDAMEDRLHHVERSLRLLPAIVRKLYFEGLELPPPFDLLSQRFGISSQNDEDGLILALFKRAGITDRRFVEIGCGFNGGNSGFLASECGWSGLMLDARGAAVETIRTKYAGHDVLALRRKVTAESINGLLQKFEFTGELDFLSIDIDGNDYWIWKALDSCSPRVVVVEYNYLFGARASVTVPYDAEFSLDEAATRAYRGASLAALVHLGARKGYRLVATERVNAFFLRNDLAPEIPGFAAPLIYRGPKNRGKDVFEKIAKYDLPLVVVDADGEGEPSVLSSDPSGAPPLGRA